MQNKIVIYLLILASTFILFTQISYADCSGTSQTDTNGKVCLPNPLGKSGTDIPILLGKIISSVLGVVGSLALVMFIYGGITWMLSAGNQEQVTKGKNILIWATIGIVIIFSAYALVKFVLTTVTTGA